MLLQNLKIFIVSLLVFLAVDFFWLGILAKNFYDREFSNFPRTLNWPAAILVYLLIPLGIFLFVLPKSQGQPVAGLLWGAAFGMVVYGVYDLTNTAVLANWSIKMTVVDILWGMTICGITGTLMVFLSHWLK